MKFGTWLGLAALVCAAGCSSSGKKAANQGDSKAVAEALSSGITVEHGKKLAGVIPKATATDVDVQQDDKPLALAPSVDDAIMSLDADNPDEDTDPVTAMLMQFEDSNDHFEADVEASGSDGGTADAGMTTKHYEVRFSVNDSICKNFCKGEFDGVMVQALKLKKGGITNHVKRSFKLDCRDKGAEACEKDKDDGKKDAGEDNGGGGSSADAGGGSGDTGGGSPSGIGSYVGNLKNFSKQGCTCAKKAGTTPYCDGAGLNMSAVECVRNKLEANQDMPEVSKWAACAAAVIPRLTTACKACAADMACDPSAVATAGDSCPTQLPDAIKTEVDGCKLDQAP